MWCYRHITIPYIKPDYIKSDVNTNTNPNATSYIEPDVCTNITPYIEPNRTTMWPE